MKCFCVFFLKKKFRVFSVLFFFHHFSFFFFRHFSFSSFFVRYSFVVSVFGPKGDPKTLRNSKIKYQKRVQIFKCLWPNSSFSRMEKSSKLRPKTKETTTNELFFLCFFLFEIFTMPFFLHDFFALFFITLIYRDLFW